MRFIIFCRARCGSTSLARALNCYPGVRCLIEPFALCAEYRGISDADTLDTALARIWRDHNGIKHVWAPGGWPFGGTCDLNRRLLRAPGAKVVLLTRRNALRRVVSSEMSMQTGVWTRRDEQEVAKARRFDFKPLDPERIAQQLQDDATIVAAFRTYLIEDGVTFCDLRYEELFGDRVHLTERLRVMERLRMFIDAPAPRDVATDFEIAELLNPGKRKLNQPETYRRIPNIDEIEQLFGSEESGWLFKD